MFIHPFFRLQHLLKFKLISLLRSLCRRHLYFRVSWKHFYRADWTEMIQFKRLCLFKWCSKFGSGTKFDKYYLDLEFFRYLLSLKSDALLFVDKSYLPVVPRNFNKWTSLQSVHLIRFGLFFYHLLCLLQGNIINKYPSRLGWNWVEWSHRLLLLLFTHKWASLCDISQLYKLHPLFRKNLLYNNILVF